MRRFALVGLLMLATSAAAEDWRTLSGDEVRAALTGHTLNYTSGAWQDFRASGKTLYNAGRDSWGNWRVQGSQYCSQWPPSGLWDCYDMATDGTTLRFIGSDGSTTDGVYAD